MSNFNFNEEFYSQRSLLEYFKKDLFSHIVISPRHKTRKIHEDSVLSRYFQVNFRYKLKYNSFENINYRAILPLNQRCCASS